MVDLEKILSKPLDTMFEELKKDFVNAVVDKLLDGVTLDVVLVFGQKEQRLRVTGKINVKKLENETHST